MDFFLKLWFGLALFFPKTVPSYLLPGNIRAEILAREDDQSGLDVYQLLKSLVVFINGIQVMLPNGEYIDFGSIPRFIHWLAWPTELELRVPYAKHDVGYTLQGGLRCFINHPGCCEELHRNPQSRLRLDYELMRDIIVCKMTGRWNPFRGLTWTPLRDIPMRAVLIVYRTWLIVWHPFRAVIIFLVVRAAGWKAWNTIEPETQPHV